MTRDNLEDKMFHSIIINFKMGHKSINVRNRCMCFSNISQNATYRNQLLHSLDYVQTRPIARQMLFPGGARRIVRKRLGLLNFTWGSWKLCVGSPTVSNFSKLVSTPEHVSEQHVGTVRHQSTASYKFIRRMGMRPHRDTLPARLVQCERRAIDGGTRWQNGYGRVFHRRVLR